MAKFKESPVVAMVGTQPVTYDDLQILAAQNGYNLLNKEDVALALRDATNMELLAMEAEKRGYQNDPDIRRYVKAQATQKLLRETVDSKQEQATISDSELKAYYDKNLKEFTPPTLAKAQILALLKRKGKEAALAQKLDAVKQAIEAKQMPFSELVKQFSDDPAAKTYGGMTNWLVKGEPNKQYPESLLKAVFDAKDPLGVAGPIETNDWIYFVKLSERRDGKTTGFEQSKAAIAQQLQRRKRLDSYNGFVDTLRKDSKVDTWPEVVEEQMKAVAKQSGPPMGPVRVAK